MGRSSSSSPPDIEDHGDLGFHYRFPFRRNSKSNSFNNRDKTNKSSSDRQWRSTTTTHHLHSRPTRSERKGWLKINGMRFLYCAILLAVFGFLFVSVVLQINVGGVFKSGGDWRGMMSVRDGLMIGSELKFVVSDKLVRRFEERGGIDRMRNEGRIGVRPPRIALVLGSVNKQPSSLGLFTVMKNLKELGYSFEIFSVQDGVVQSFWEKLGVQVRELTRERYALVDWLSFDGIVAATLEATEAVSSLLQEPFCSVPLIWIMQEDTLAKRLPMYKDSGNLQQVSHWKNVLSRADVVVFSDFSLSILYSVLDNGNFYVIPGSTNDVWAAESYSKIHTKSKLRKSLGYSEDDMLILVLGSLFFYNGLSWDYAVAMHVIGPLLKTYASREDAGVSYKFLFVCGNSSEEYTKNLQELASRLGLPRSSIRHYGMDEDVNSLLMMSDIVLYGSSQDFQEIPPLLIRAMSFGIPLVVPDFTVTELNIVDSKHGMVYPKHNPEALMKVFSELITDGKLSALAQEIAANGKKTAKNMLASECVSGYARLFENLISFSSDVTLPNTESPGQLSEWDWEIVSEETESRSFDLTDFGRERFSKGTSVVDVLEEYITNHIGYGKSSKNETDIQLEDLPNKSDWDILDEIDKSEDYEKHETAELEERLEKGFGVWDDIYRNARKAEKLKF